MGRKAIIMDRDGTLCEEVGYINHIDRLRLPDRSIEAVLMARRAGFATVVVTNQAGVARGYFDEELIHRVHHRIRELILVGGGDIDAFYYCPHHPEVGEPPYRLDCNCRKPRTGMLEQARDDLGIDLSASYMIGDSIRDIRAGHAAGATTILVLTGYGKGQLEYRSSTWDVRPDHIADDLLDAVGWIASRHGGEE